LYVYPFGRYHVLNFWEAQAKLDLSYIRLLDVVSEWGAFGQPMAIISDGGTFADQKIGDCVAKSRIANPACLPSRDRQIATR
jgi:hypothetical protein